MRREAALVAAFSLLLVGCAQALPVENVGPFPTDPKALILSPKAGQTVPGPDVQVQLGTQGSVKIVAAADASDPHKYGEAHYHLFLDLTPTSAGEGIPNAPGIIHTTDSSVTLPGLASGTHTLYVELGYSDHTPYQHSLSSVSFCVGKCSVAVKLPTPGPSSAPSSAPSSGPSSAPSSAPSAAASTPAGNGTVAQKIDVGPDASVGGKYSPNNVTVKVGDTVQWTWSDGSAQHTVTSDNGDFDSGLKSKGDTWPFTFTKAGTYKYTCQIHPDMHGTVTVQ